MARFKNKSKIYEMSDEKFIELYHKCDYLNDMIRAFDLVVRGSSYKVIKKRLISLNLDLDKFSKNASRGQTKIIKSNEEMFKICKNNFSNQSVKKRILKYNLLDYKCDFCGLREEWNNKKLVLQLDHKNGLNNDNRLENLKYGYLSFCYVRQCKW